MFLLTETYLRDNRIFFHLWLLLWADSWKLHLDVTCFYWLKLTSVTTEYFFIYDCCYGQTVETICERFPQFDIVSSFAWKKGCNFLEICPCLCYHTDMVPTFPDWQNSAVFSKNSAVFSQRISRCFIIFKVTSKLFWNKICNPKGVSFEQKFTFSTEHRRKTSLSVSTLFLQIWRCCIVSVSRPEAENLRPALFLVVLSLFKLYQVEWEPSITTFFQRINPFHIFENSYTQLQICLSWYNIC